MRRNKMRELLREGKPSIGTHVLSTWPALVEIIGETGLFDYVQFDGEYAPYDLYALENFARAVDLFDNMSSLIKVDQEPRTYLTQRAIGSGIQNILFADVRTVEDVEQCVRAARAETPESKGTLGCTMRRDSGYGRESGSIEVVRSLDEVVVILMIEKANAVNHLEELLAVQGVDMVTFGYCDYAMSIGLPDQWDHPKVKEAERKTFETALKMGVTPRAEVHTVDQAKHYIDLGVRHLSVGWDLVILRDWWKKNGEELRKLVS